MKISHQPRPNVNFPIDLMSVALQWVKGQVKRFSEFHTFSKMSFVSLAVAKLLSLHDFTHGCIQCHPILISNIFFSII